MAQTTRLLTVYFARAEAAWQQSRMTGLRPALEAAADRQPGLTTASLPLLRLESDPTAVAKLNTALARPGPQAYLFSSLRAVEALADLGCLQALDPHAPLYCVGKRALAALRAAGFDGPSLTAPTAATLENAIIEAGQTTSGGATGAAPWPQIHYFCAAEVSHDFAALAASLAAKHAPSLTWHHIYAASAVPDDDPALASGLIALAKAPEAALVLVYSRALARRLARVAAGLVTAGIAEPATCPDWRHRLPVLCLSQAIAVELEAWDFRTISVAQTPNEEGLAALLNARLPGLDLRLASQPKPSTA